MSKKLDLTKTVYELCKEYPELQDIMVELGFTEITKPMAMNTMGRVMTIPKGAIIKEIPMNIVVNTLQEHGFELIGSGMGAKSTSQKTEKEAQVSRDRVEEVKSYIKRLSAGEDLESVRKDFVEAFQDVDAMEIARAEQEIIKEGMPIAEVTKLCDVHSALFHGKTVEEKITMSEGQIMKEAAKMRTNILTKTMGHPLHTFAMENEGIEHQIEKVRRLGGISKDGDASEKNIQACLEEAKVLRALAIHYAKKGDLIYPLLSSRYDIVGPGDVMWSVDDEIRDALRAATAFEEIKNEEAWLESLDGILTRAEEMIYKEKNILFPMCGHNFNDEEWLGIYRDAQDYDLCFQEEREIWPLGEDFLKKEEEKKCASLKATDATEGDSKRLDGSMEVVIPGGHMTLDELSAMLNTIPMEISFVDRNDINRYFNEGSKLFKRAEMALDREVYSCHPPKIEPMVRAILGDFKDGNRDSVDVWMEKGGAPVLVRYMAVRDRQGEYLGCLEVIQDMTFAKKHFEK